MSFIKNFISEDLGCDNSVIANPDTTGTVWPGGDALTMFLLANDSDPEGNNFILTHIEGTPVVNGSGPLVFGDATINVVDVTTGEITYALDAAATETLPLTYTIQDDGIPPATDSAIFKPIFGLCNAIAFTKNEGGGFVQIVSGSSAAYVQGFIDINDDGTPDASSGIIASTPSIVVVGGPLINGSTFEVVCYQDSAGLLPCSSDKRKIPAPVLDEVEPVFDGDPWELFFISAGDPYSTFYRNNFDEFSLNLIIIGGTYAGSYSNIGCQQGGITNISLLPVGLQALLNPTFEGLEVRSDLWDVEGATQIQASLNALHNYTVGLPLASSTGVVQTYTP